MCRGHNTLSFLLLGFDLLNIQELGLPLSIRGEANRCSAVGFGSSILRDVSITRFPPMTLARDSLMSCHVSKACAMKSMRFCDACHWPHPTKGPLLLAVSASRFRPPQV